ncbi:glycosyl transferase [Clostridium autoethanogenum]|uniref:Glycosyl transferase n=1 Tax=Clostridium autoethanogenum TaxID=84023 RepID=A0A3M0SY11_9CLOT|nr:glycosyl transferase [Clostridium autoethanogenum]RMD03226.1 glycosyl transferase [Clostridium autoethanogenum]
MIGNKFNLATVRKYKEKLDNLGSMVNDLLYGIGLQKINKEDKEILIRSFDNVVKLSGMYNDVAEQVISNKQIITNDPQKYIGDNLSNACTLTEMVYNKYKHLSRFGK